MATKYVRCFYQCRTNICKSCFKKLIKLDSNNDVSYTCPVCRQVSIRHQKKNFTRYSRAHLDVCEAIIKLFENQKLSQDWTDHQMDFVNHLIDSRLNELDLSNMPLHILDQLTN
jgi:hypothetical protein